MLYSDDYRFAFVHIPKCAGTSLRTELRSAANFPQKTVDLDISGLEVERLPGSHDLRVHHELLGSIHLAHLPLVYLRDYFQATFALLRSVDIFAIVRDPRSRFLSAVTQRLREFKGVGSTHVSPELICAEAEHVCEWLDSAKTFCELEYIHFTRQVDYVYLDGEAVVQHLYPIEEMDAARHWLIQDRGVPSFEAQRTNSSVQPAGWYRRIHQRASPFYRRAVPKKMRSLVFPIIHNSWLFSSASKGYQNLDLGATLETFIERYYIEDAALHQEALARVATWKPSA